MKEILSQMEKISIAFVNGLPVKRLSKNFESLRPFVYETKEILFEEVLLLGHGDGYVALVSTHFYLYYHALLVQLEFHFLIQSGIHKMSDREISANLKKVPPIAPITLVSRRGSRRRQTPFWKDCQ